MCDRSPSVEVRHLPGTQAGGRSLNARSADDGTTQAAEFLSDPSQVRRLRRCANPACSVIFIAVNPRRSWCAPGICGNRVRVARHHRRAGGSDGAPSGQRSRMRESGRPRRFRSATNRRSRSSCGAATMTITSRSSGGSRDLIVAPGSGVRAEKGTIVTPMPAAASCAAVRGKPVRNAGCGSPVLAAEPGGRGTRGESSRPGGRATRSRTVAGATRHVRWSRCQ